MNKSKKIIISIVIGLIIILLLIFGYKKYMEYREEERIRNAIIKIDFVNPLEVSFNSDVKLSDLITSINGELLDDFKINTQKVGLQQIKFKYLNEEDIKVPYSFFVNVRDVTPPVIWLNDTYTVNVGYSKNLSNAIMCGDDLDDNPKCQIVGEYDTNKIGNYKLTYEAIDNSGNITEKVFTLKVIKKGKSNSSNVTTIPFGSLYNEYKKNNTKIGIDVSKWQGDIDYEKVKNAGVEFVYIKLGGQSGIGKDYYLDSKFKQNIEGFKKVGIPVGLYFYSYANSEDAAYRDAMWIIDQVKDYDIDLEIAFDWENWSSFNNFHVSFYTLTKTAEKFMSTLEKHGYKSMLYSSKNYLEKIWMATSYPVWLAHYTSKTSYSGNYKCWQRTSSAKISGITANTVDVDICYN